MLEHHHHLLILLLLCQIFTSGLTANNKCYHNQKSLSPVLLDLVTAKCATTKTIITLSWSEAGFSPVIIEDGTFASYAVLEKLHLERMDLVTVEDSAFCGTQINTFTIKNTALATVPDFSCLSATLTSVTIQQCLLTTITPADFSALNNLEKINLEMNDLTAVDIADLPALISLKMSWNDFSAFPTLTNVVDTLKVLHLSRCGLTTLVSPYFDELAVEELNLLGNALEELVDFTHLADDLLSLDVKLNELTDTAYAKINQLNVLQVLDISNNSFTAFPVFTNPLLCLSLISFTAAENLFLDIGVGTLDCFVNLTILDLRFNSFTELPTLNIVGSSLQDLNFDHNDIAYTTPNPLGTLSDLLTISIRYNNLTRVPDLSNCVSSLMVLNLEHNVITNIDPLEVTLMPALEDLHLSHNAIDEFPVLGAVMPNIRNIYLDQNPMTSVPPEAFDGLNLLVILNLDNSELTEIPNLDELAGRLKEFHIRNNSITSIPADQFANLQRLELLDLRDNFIEEFPVLPPPINDTLKYLYLDNTGISNVTDAHLRQVPLLVDLLLDGNELETLPDITWMRYLKKLYFNDNPLICDTELCWQKHVHSSVTSTSYPDCAGPPDVAGDNLASLSRSIICPSPVCIDDLGNDFGGVVQDFGTYLSARLYVLHDYTVPWDGLVYRYKFYAHIVGEIYVGFWRKVGSSKNIELIGKVQIIITEAGIQEYDPDPVDRISVQTGDILSLHHSDTSYIISTQELPADYEPLPFGIEPHQLSRVTKQPIHNDDLVLNYVGNNWFINYWSKMTLSVSYLVSCPGQILDTTPVPNTETPTTMAPTTMAPPATTASARTTEPMNMQTPADMSTIEQTTIVQTTRQQSTIPPETTEATVAMTTTQSTIATTNKPMTTIVPPTTTIFKTTINTFQSTTRLTPKVTTHSQVALQSTTYSSTEVILYSTVAKHIPDFNFSAANELQTPDLETKEFLTPIEAAGAVYLGTAAIIFLASEMTLLFLLDLATLRRDVKILKTNIVKSYVVYYVKHLHRTAKVGSVSDAVEPPVVAAIGDVGGVMDTDAAQIDGNTNAQSQSDMTSRDHTQTESADHAEAPSIADPGPVETFSEQSLPVSVEGSVPEFHGNTPAALPPVESSVVHSGQSASIASGDAPFAAPHMRGSVGSATFSVHSPTSVDVHLSE